MDTEKWAEFEKTKIELNTLLRHISLQVSVVAKQVEIEFVEVIGLYVKLERQAVELGIKSDLAAPDR